MLTIKKFTFNPFSENTYILSDETKECIIIDPGCYEVYEQETLKKYIEENQLNPVKLVLTHSHIDHVLGNNFIVKQFHIPICGHPLAKQGIQMMPVISKMYGIPAIPSPDITHELNEGDLLEFGNTKMQMLHCPGHSPDSLVFYHNGQKIIIAGDVLFYGSIGRTDLPGGDYNTLMNSIKQKLFQLGDDYLVYSGHGPETTIGEEKMNNPFLQ